jgi:hypothetical protein
MNKSSLAMTILALMSIFVVACTAVPSVAPTSPPAESGTLPAGKGMLEVRVTDPPPPDMDHVWVDIANLEVHKAGGKWTTVATETEPFDLKAIEGIEEFLANQIVDAGRYTQIRLDVETVKIVVGEDEYDAKVPSGKIKLVGTFEVEENNTTVITLDFIGKESVLVTGNGQYIFKPVIKLLIAGEGDEEPTELEATLETSGEAVAESSDAQAHSGDESAHLQTTGTEGTGDEARIVVPLPEGTTLGDIESISWWVYTVAGYPPHVDIVMDVDGEGDLDNEDMLTAEMAYNNADGIELDEGLTPTTGGWLQTFELTSGDGYGAIGDDTMLWVTKLGAGNDDAPWLTLADWKDGTVAPNDPGSDGLAAGVITGSAPVLRLEIEIDNWVLQTETYVDDIVIVIGGVTYTIDL